MASSAKPALANTINLNIGGSLELVLVPPPPQIQTIVKVRYGAFEATAKGEHMAYTLPNDKLIVVQVAYVDAHNNPAKIDGAVAWNSSDDNIATVTVDSQDSTICTVTPSGIAGGVQVSATADADLGEGVRSLITLLDVTVVAGEAVAGTISVVGDPQPVAPHPEQQKRR